MKKVLVSIRRFLQNKFPFQGKIVFKLEGEAAVFITSFKPETALFRNGRAYARLIPNSLIEEGGTYYHYEIYAQGHMPGVYLSEPVDSGVCLVPEYDCCLEDIISSIPDKNSADEIVAKASGMIAEIREALEQARECARNSCECAASSRQSERNISSLVQDASIAYNSAQTKYKQLQKEFEDFEEYLERYEEKLKTEIKQAFYENTQNLLHAIHEEELLINSLWQQIEERFADIKSLEDYFEKIQNFITDSIQETIDELTRTLNSVQQDVAELQQKNVVYICGQKESVSQLPESGREGDTWALPDNSLYIWYNDTWNHVSTKRQADTFEQLPSNELELAAMAAFLEKGAHLTIIK